MSIKISVREHIMNTCTWSYTCWVIKNTQKVNTQHFEGYE